jgi:pleckstrin domain-containing family G protein 5
MNSFAEKLFLISQLDVHAFLFTDMLLLCKVLTKKSHSSNPEARMKIIRQPLIVDRLVVSEINKESACGIAVIYLNEYQVVSMAFTLHSSEAKVLRIWREQLAKAKELYCQAKSASHRFVVGQYSADTEDDCSSGLVANYLSANDLPTPSTGPRRGSFRGSRISSIGHSHSGSVDLMETVPSFRYIDLTLRPSFLRLLS